MMVCERFWGFCFSCGEAWFVGLPRGLKAKTRLQILQKFQRLTYP